MALPSPLAAAIRVPDFAGRAVAPADAGYEALRRVWNGMIDCRPRLILQCESASDVVAALAFAEREGLPIAVRGGGHSAAGHGTIDGGLLIDLSPMNSVSVDPAARRAEAGGGAKWAAFDAATQRHGLAAPGGVISSTGVAGLTLGGGIGWLSRKHGLSCDNLVEATMVTADGRILTLSAGENPDLFWAIRGGGGNFGVVTRFRFQAHPLGPQVLCGRLVFPAAIAGEVLPRYRDIAKVAPDNLAAYASLGRAADETPILTLSLLWADEPAEGLPWIDRFRAISGLMADDVRLQPYVDFQSMSDSGQPAGQRVYWRSSYFREMTDAALDLLAASAAAAPSTGALAIVERYGGAASRVPVEATAYPHRDVEYLINVIASWTDPADDAAHVGWVKGVWESMRPFTHDRTYVNFLGEGSDSRVRAAYGPNYARLAAIKAQVDPDNIFRRNANIPPAGGGAA